MCFSIVTSPSTFSWGMDAELRWSHHSSFNQRLWSSWDKSSNHDVSVLSIKYYETGVLKISFGILQLCSSVTTCVLMSVLAGSGTGLFESKTTTWKAVGIFLSSPTNKITVNKEISFGPEAFTELTCKSFGSCMALDLNCSLKVSSALFFCSGLQQLSKSIWACFPWKRFISQTWFNLNINVWIQKCSHCSFFVAFSVEMLLCGCSFLSWSDLPKSCWFQQPCRDPGVCFTRPKSTMLWFPFH